jgi:hypothetical protein
MFLTVFIGFYILTVLGLVFWGYTPSAQALQDAYQAKVMKDGFQFLLATSFAYIDRKIEDGEEDDALIEFAEQIGYFDLQEDAYVSEGELDDVDSYSSKEEF